MPPSRIPFEAQRWSCRVVRYGRMSLMAGLCVTWVGEDTKCEADAAPQSAGRTTRLEIQVSEMWSEFQALYETLSNRRK